MPEDARGELSGRNMYMESPVVVRRASFSTVYLCIVCAQVCAGLQLLIARKISKVSSTSRYIFIDSIRSK